MKEVRPDIRNVATVSVIIFIFLLICFYYFTDTEQEIILSSIKHSTAAITIIGFFWVIFNKWAWKLRCFRVMGWLCQAPNLHGRWEGLVCRNGSNEMSHPFILEISQTFTTIKCRTFGSRSSGDSISIVLFSKDEQGLMWEAVCIWMAKARRMSDKESIETFYGTSIWEISIDPMTGEKTIKDNYYTSRNTSGRIDVKWTSERLKGKHL